MARQMADAYPNIAELSQAISHEGGLGACDDDVEFAFGLDLILDGLEQLRTASSRSLSPVASGLRRPVCTHDNRSPRNVDPAR